MKTSYTQTPRSLEQAQFITDADPFDYAPRGIDRQDKIVLWGCTAAAVVLALILRAAW